MSRGRAMRRTIPAGSVVALAMTTALLTATTQVALSAPAQLAADAFGRSATNGWGNADVGGPWSLAGAASAFSVSGGTGRMVMPSAGSSFAAYLGSASSSDTQATGGVSLNKAQTGGGTYGS